MIREVHHCILDITIGIMLFKKAQQVPISHFNVFKWIGCGKVQMNLKWSNCNPMPQCTCFKFWWHQSLLYDFNLCRLVFVCVHVNFDINSILVSYIYIHCIYLDLNVVQHKRHVMSSLIEHFFNYILILEQFIVLSNMLITSFYKVGILQPTLKYNE